MMQSPGSSSSTSTPSTPIMSSWQPVHARAGGPRGKTVLDPIHGHVDLCATTTEFIDTEPFQRLRDLHQLGTANFVFPGASHTRFEHSIGVCHLADQLLTRLRFQQPELGIDEHDILMVKLAGLCHDLGHGPFSHVFDGEFIPRVLPGSTWTHEEGSTMMLDYLVDDNNIDLDPEDLAFIKDLINPYANDGTGGRSKFTDKLFLYDVVANSRNSVDVDKMDYLQRDAYYLGVKVSVDVQRLIKSTRVIGDEICFHGKSVYDLYQLFHARYSLFKTVYSHRVSKAIEYMITDALVEADPVYGLSKAIYDPRKYCHLTDCILKRIETSEQSELAHARELIRRIRRRDLYALVGETILPEAVGISAADLVDDREGGLLKERDLIVQNTRINYALKDKNPVDNVRFFRDWDATQAARLSREKVSLLVPQNFQEYYVRVYVRDTSNPLKLELAQAAFQRWLAANKYGSPNPAFQMKRTASGSLTHESLASAAASAAAGASSSSASAAGPSPRSHRTPGTRLGDKIKRTHQLHNISSISPCPTPRKRIKRGEGLQPKHIQFGNTPVAPSSRARVSVTGVGHNNGKKGKVGADEEEDDEM